MILIYHESDPLLLAVGVHTERFINVENRIED